MKRLFLILLIMMMPACAGKRIEIGAPESGGGIRLIVEDRVIDLWSDADVTAMLQLLPEDRRLEAFTLVNNTRQQIVEAVIEGQQKGRATWQTVLIELAKILTAAGVSAVVADQVSK